MATGISSSSGGTNERIAEGLQEEHEGGGQDRRDHTALVSHDHRDGNGNQRMAVGHRNRRPLVLGVGHEGETAEHGHGPHKARGCAHIHRDRCGAAEWDAQAADRDCGSRSLGDRGRRLPDACEQPGR
jgi:hypothetical protein